jgi:hypothetical protein
MPLWVYGKNEPLKVDKLMEYRHRTISMADWTVNIVELACSSWRDENGKIKTWDDVVREFGRMGALGASSACVIGHDLRDVLTTVGKEWEGRVVLDYDVRQWDRNLPMGVIEALYRATVFDSHVAASLTGGLCGQGNYILSDGLFALPDGCSAWCSGALKTLSGNSLIHEALLRLLDLEGLVMGDDGNVVVEPQQADDVAAKITSAFGAAGMQLKRIEKMKEINFCALCNINGVPHADLHKIASKMLATSWGDTLDVEQADALVQISLYFPPKDALSGEVLARARRVLADSVWRAASL